MIFHDIMPINIRVVCVVAGCFSPQLARRNAAAQLFNQRPADAANGPKLRTSSGAQWAPSHWKLIPTDATWLVPHLDTFLVSALFAILGVNKTLEDQDWTIESWLGYCFEIW